jgi:hypothetical protein
MIKKPKPISYSASHFYMEPKNQKKNLVEKQYQKTLPSGKEIFIKWIKLMF